MRGLRAIPPTEEAVIADWILVPCLVRLRSEFNLMAPNRDHASDGSIGDTAHQNEVSDHNPDETGSVPIHDADHTNEVHAIDVDTDFRVPGLTMEKVVQFLLGRCRAGTEKRLRYIIYNRRIWEASNDWRQRAYTGSSPHTEHAHFSASYVTSLEASTASWHLEDIPVALTADDKAWITKQINSIVSLSQQADKTPSSPVGAAWSAQGIPNGTRPVDSAGAHPRDVAWLVIQDLGEALVALQTQVDEIKSLLTSPSS
jgi:hypothetical protein